MVSNGFEIRSNGTFSSCCVSDKLFVDSEGKPYNVNTHNIQEVLDSQDRKDFIENFDKHFKTDCRRCLDVEIAGGDSKRINEIRNFGNDPGDPNQIKYLDLKMGNTCNLACSICWPGASSKWASIFRKEGWGDPRIEQWQEKDSFWQQMGILSANSKRIELSGGEPFMIKKQSKLIEFLVESGQASEIDILWITNCTVWPKNIVEHFKHFKMVRIMLSLDNTHEQFEYLRWPGVWKDTYEVFLKWRELDKQGIINLGISYSINMLNIWNTPDFHAWAREHEVRVYNNIVWDPMSVSALPLVFKKLVMEKFALSNDPSFQTNPAVGADNWITKFMMQEGDTSQAIKYHNHRVIKTRGREAFENAFPVLANYL